ncbi:MAG TPA: NADH-quinone oxidoreductase subunit NuoN [Candidatus Pelagibacter sp.]|jgi:NADH-quinone oxidoreductase subunit N|nr:NADH-quinone oxidoreductase subunit NuoN [Candidatus Pelagibacter sp.]|tara:strand:+ start:10470 stop:11885 length:1416 start_codon:yes stop_codon:yes gene_type:complete
MTNLNLIFPEIFISLAIMFLLIVGVFKKNSSNLIYNLTIISLLIALALIFNYPIETELSLFNESYKIDYLSTFMKILTLVSGIFVMLTSSKYVQITKILKIEYPVLLLSSILGMMVMISSNDLIVFYMGLELQSLSLYVLASFNTKNLLSSESGVKYFVLSALSSGLLLYGCSLIYGFSNSTNFILIAENLNSSNYGLTFGIVFILVGLAFKISAVPFHMWAPDVYQGSPTSVTIFFAVLPKIAALTVFIRFLYIPFINLIDQWQMIIVFLSIASMLFGAIAAIGQKNLKRLIAYSSIGHMGYALAGLSVGSNEGIQSAIAYISIYLIMNLAFFSCLFMIRKSENYFENIEDLTGLSKNHPILSISLLIVLFSLAGIPPLAGFFAKFYIFMAVIEQSMYFLAVIGLLSTVIAAYYYLRIIKIIYFDPEKEKYDTDHHLGLKVSLAISTIFILFYFIYPSGLTEIISKINII